MEPVGYLILLIYFAALIGIGALYARKQGSVSDFFLAGRTIPAWAVLASVVATETSAVTLIGTPAISFRPGGDFSFLQVALGFIIARVLISLFFLPKFFEHEIVTIYAYLGLRFGVSTQRVAGIFFFITRAMASGVRHYAAALVISSFTGIDLTGSILIIGLVCLIYSLMGGLSAVIWTEVLQFGIMILGSILAFIYLVAHIPGGLSEAFSLAQVYHKTTIFHWQGGVEGTYSLLGGLLGGICLSLATHGADQDLVQRLLACRSLRGAQAALIGSGLFVFIQFTFFLVIGVLLFAFYGSLPPQVEKEDQLLLYFVANHIPPVAAALVIAAILSAALSSTASALNALASASVADFVMPMLKTSATDQTLVRISRAFTLLWTVVLIGIAILARKSQYVLDTGLSIPAYTYGSLLAAFLLGIFTSLRRVAPLLIGMIAGVGLVLALTQYKIHWTWLYPAGTLMTIVVALGLNQIMQIIETRKTGV